MDIEDPWHWPVDRVVQELCTTNRSWQPRTPSMVIPDTVSLEKALREHQVTGSVLLVDVDDKAMRRDLGLKVLGWRAFIRDGIDELRVKSVQYQAWLQTHLPRHIGSLQPDGSVSHVGYPIRQHGSDRDRASGFAHQSTLDSVQTPPLGEHLARDSLPPSEPMLDFLHSASRMARAQTPMALNVEGDYRRFSPMSHMSSHDDVVVSDDSIRKRRKLNVTTVAENVTLPAENEVHHYLDDETETLQFENGPLSPTPVPVTSSAPEINSKKRRRVAPTLITSEIDPDRNRDIPTEADTVIQHDPNNVEPGVPFIGDDGRKRLVPIRDPDSDSEAPYAYADHLHARKPEKRALDRGGAESLKAAQNILEEAKWKNIISSKNSLAMGYLGRDKMPVDDIFYEGIAVGQEFPASSDTEEFCLGPKNISSGRRLYVHGILRHFFRSERQIIWRNGKWFSAIVPYSENLTPKHHKRSFTLFSASGTQIHAMRQEVASWPELYPKTRTPKQQNDTGYENHATFNLPYPDMLEGIGSFADWDPSCLEKYRLLEGGDEILPLYGESDEENEYDIDTWREIEKEKGDLNLPLIPLKRRHLSLDEVNRAIDDGIAEMVVKWNREKLPKRQRKAWSIWMKSRREGTKRKLIRNVQMHLNRIKNDRIAKMRTEIANEIWTSERQVRKQTRIMEPSIFDREDLAWQISTLESKTAPEKFTNQGSTIPASKSKKVPSLEGEEGESLENTSDISSSDDGLADFVVSDDEVGIDEEIELGLADGEDEDDAILSEASVFNRLHSPSRLQSKIVNSHRVRSNFKQDELMADALGDAFRSALSDGGDYSSLSHDSMIKQSGEVDRPTLPKHPAASPGSIPELIDLTMFSSDDGPPVINLVTPRKPRIKLILRNSPIKISDEEIEIPDLDHLPPYDNPAAIAQYSYETWAKLCDRERLLINVVHLMDDLPRISLFTFISSISEDDLWCSMTEVMDAFVEKSDNVKGMDTETCQILTGFIRLFEMFIDCKYHSYSDRLIGPAVKKLIASRTDWFPQFYQLCRRLEGYFDHTLVVDTETPGEVVDGDEGEIDDEELQLSVERHSRTVTSDEDHLAHDTPHKKRKRKIFEDANARDLREKDRQRLAEQDERRRKLQANLAMSGHVGDVDRGRIIINDGKFDYQGYVYVNDQIGRRIKKHQIEGVRFMWSQIVTDGTKTQGCLLAHTMGLGKTMQVITLLVAIAEASASKDKTVSSQIPAGLQLSRTLVLCPPGLIGNWMDELLTWAPEDILGNLAKIDSSVKPNDRLRIITNWHHRGGVLVMGYEMFRNIIINKKQKNREAPLSDQEHEQVCTELLDGPNIIVADEAHKMKNSGAGITMAASQFRSKSRIAMTGSPLANNVEEYHTMIEWIEPNYLGPIVEFRAKYVEPIECGLWGDSTSYERRRSLKMLGVLKEDLSPKVHRADMSVLRNDLLPKKEFVITVPLTELQRKAYSLYVQSMTSGHSRSATGLTKAGDVHQVTIWHWLNVLSLLCNHPDCFKSKLNERKEDAQRESSVVINTSASRDGTEEEEAIAAEINAPVWKTGVSEDLIREETKLFNKEVDDIKSIDLSNKIKILVQILDASRAVKDKVLVFSQSLATLDFLEELCNRQGRKYARLDGSTKMNKRLGLTKDFNTGHIEIYLISTTAGGLGLNLPGANRVVIFDFRFNPIMEEQAVGRAYRIGQKKPVFVYRFVAGGTFEDCVHNKAVFKMQLASRVVDKKNPIAWAKKKLGDFLFEPKDVEQKDLSEFKGMDPHVLDKILASQDEKCTIRAIVQTDTFERDDEDRLTVEEQKEVKQLLSDEQLKRDDPAAWQALMAKRTQVLYSRQQSNAAGVIQALKNPNPVHQSGGALWPSGGSGSSTARAVEPPPILPPVKEAYSLTPTSMPIPISPLRVEVSASPRVGLKSSGDRSPIAGTNTKVRLASPDHILPRLVEESRDKGPNIVEKVSGGATNFSQASVNSVKYQSEQNMGKENQAFQRLQSTLIATLLPLNRANGKSYTATQLRAETIAKEIKASLERCLTTENTLEAAMDSASANLQADQTKCQALLTSRINADQFTGGIYEPSTAQSKLMNIDSIGNKDKVGNSDKIPSNHNPSPRVHPHHLHSIKAASGINDLQVAADVVHQSDEFYLSTSKMLSRAQSMPPNVGLHDDSELEDQVASHCSQMFNVMNRQPVRSLKTPITKPSKIETKMSLRTPLSKDDAQRREEKRRLRGVKAQPASTPTHRSASTRLPPWAISSIDEPKSRSTSRTTPSSTRK